MTAILYTFIALCLIISVGAMHLTDRLCDKYSNYRNGLHLTGNTVDSNSDSFTEKEPIALKVVTDKHEVMPEEIWDQSIFSIFPVSETIMSFTPPPI